MGREGGTSQFCVFGPGGLEVGDLLYRPLKISGHIQIKEETRNEHGLWTSSMFSLSE